MPTYHLLRRCSRLSASPSSPTRDGTKSTVRGRSRWRGVGGRAALLCRRVASYGTSQATCAPMPRRRRVLTTCCPRPTVTCRLTARRYRLACGTSMSLRSAVTRSCSTTARYTAPTATATAPRLGRTSPRRRARSSARRAAASRAVLAAGGRGRYGQSVTGRAASTARHSRCAACYNPLPRPLLHPLATASTYPY